MAKAPKVKLTYLDDTEAECLFTARVQVAIERHFGKKLTDILDSAEAVYFGAYIGLQQKGELTGVDFDDWLNTVSDVEMVEEESPEVDPTKPAPAEPA